MALQDSAPDAPIAGLMAEKVDDVILVRTDQVHRGDRLRSVDPVWARALGTIMAREGQNTPIEVCRLPGKTEWELVAGAHRHAGAEFSGIEYLKAIVVSADRADRRMREISENLWRQGLDPIDRAAFIAELVTLKRTQAGLDVAAHRAASVADRFKKRIDDEANETLDTMSSVYGWSDEVAEQIGISGRTVRRDLMIFRGIAPSLIAKLREARHPVATNGTQLRALAKLDASEQQKAVWCLLNSATIKSVGDAIAQTRGSNRAIDPEAKRLSTFIGTFARMALAEKKGALSELRPLLPAGQRLVDASQESRPDDRYRVEMIGALEAAFEVLTRLYEGEEPVEDGEIYAARSKIQLSLMAANAGAIPTPKGDAA